MLKSAIFLLAPAMAGLWALFPGFSPSRQTVSTIIISPQKSISHSTLRPCYTDAYLAGSDCLVQEVYCKPTGSYSVRVCNHEELVKQWIAGFDDGQPHAIDLNATITASDQQTGLNTTFFTSAMDQQTRNNSTLSIGERSISIDGISVVYKQGIYQVENGQIKVAVLLLH